MISDYNMMVDRLVLAGKQKVYYLRLLKTNLDYLRLLELTQDYLRLLETTLDHLGLLETTGFYHSDFCPLGLLS